MMSSTLSCYKVEFILFGLALFIDKLIPQMFLWCFLNGDFKIWKFSGFRQEIENFVDLSQAFCGHVQKNNIDLDNLKRILVGCMFTNIIFFVLFMIWIW